MSPVVEKSTLIYLFAFVCHIGAVAGLTVASCPLSFKPSAFIDISIFKHHGSVAVPPAFKELAFKRHLLIVAEDALQSWCRREKRSRLCVVRLRLQSTTSRNTLKSSFFRFFTSY